VKAFLDTHAAVALGEGKVKIFGAQAADLLEHSALFVSPIVRLELALLHEIGRIRIEPDKILGILVTSCSVIQADDPITAIVAEAMSLQWTRDPFDRLLVATAMLHRAPLITKDQRILEHFEDAVW
jgi:PIN domain nuclease of toxin-antitoxin system